MYQWGALLFVFGGLGYELFDELYSDIYRNKKVVRRRKDSLDSDVEEV